MRKAILIGLIVGSLFCSRTPIVAAQAPASPIQPQSNAPTSALTVPTGTVVPVTLASPILGKNAHKGTAVHALIGAPVTAGNETVIPTGTAVEGAIEEIYWHRHTQPGMRVHFTKLVFASGYSVAIDAVSNTGSLSGNTTHNFQQGPVSEGTARFELATYPVPAHGSAAYDDATSTGIVHFVLAAQQMPAPPTLPPLPHNGPGVGTFVAISVAVTALTVVLIAFGVHHWRSNAAFDVGWPFNMVLQSPLSLDAANVMPGAGAN